MCFILCNNCDKVDKFDYLVNKTEQIIESNKVTIDLIFNF